MSTTSDPFVSWIMIPKKPSELEALVTQAGLKTLVRCWFYHQDGIVEKTTELLLAFARVDPHELLTNDLKRHIMSSKDYITFLHDHFQAIVSDKDG